MLKLAVRVNMVKADFLACYNRYFFVSNHSVEKQLI
jgi:hypothetical protein